MGNRKITPKGLALPCCSISTQAKIALGSVLSTCGALGFFLSLLLEWTSAPRPWDFLLGFVVGVLVGLGVTLVIAGLIERRRGAQ